MRYFISTYMVLGLIAQMAEDIAGFIIELHPFLVNVMKWDFPLAKINLYEQTYCFIWLTVYSYLDPLPQETFPLMELTLLN